MATNSLLSFKLQMPNNFLTKRSYSHLNVTLRDNKMKGLYLQIKPLKVNKVNKLEVTLAKNLKWRTLKLIV